MNTKNLLRIFSCLALITFLGLHAGASTDDSSVMGYDQILKDLSGSEAGTTRGSASRGEDPFANVMIHGGVGMVSTFGQVKLLKETIQTNQRGVQAALGIDLFSPNWVAEGTARSFSEESYGNSSVSLREFDLKLYYKNRITEHVGFRLGGGLAARYMTVESQTSGRHNFTTPASIAAGGLELFLAPSVSIGAEMAARSPLINETGDRASMDATVRMDAHF